MIRLVATSDLPWLEALVSVVGVMSKETADWTFTDGSSGGTE